MQIRNLSSRMRTELGKFIPAVHLVKESIKKCYGINSLQSSSEKVR